MRPSALAVSLACFLFAPGFAQAKLKVITTTQDPAAITRAIGGDRVEVKALAKGFQDPHYLDAKPTYMVDLNRADLVICVGLDLEVGYLPALISGAHNPKLNPGEAGYLDLSQFIQPLEVVPVADRSQGDIHPNGNPHYWLNPDNGLLMARGISARLSELDPGGKELYAQNLAQFEKTLAEKQQEWDKAMAKLSGRPVITFHKSWSYFAAHYHLEVVGYIEPKPGIPPTPQHTLSIIRLANEKKVRLQLMESFYDDRMPRLVASKSQAALAAVPNSVGGIERVKTYFDLFDEIVGTIAKVTGEGTR